MQRSGGTLPEAQARSLLVGIGPAVPPPTMAGLAVPRQTVTQQTWQSAPQIPGAQPAAPAAASASAAFPPMPAADAQRYQDTFMRLDTNQDGYVEVLLPSDISIHHARMFSRDTKPCERFASLSSKHSDMQFRKM